MDNIINWLCRLPSTDINFISRLERASDKEIETAIEFMQMETDKKHKTRIIACEKELRKRRKRGK